MSQNAFVQYVTKQDKTGLSVINCHTLAPVLLAGPHQICIEKYIQIKSVAVACRCWSRQYQKCPSQPNMMDM